MILWTASASGSDNTSGSLPFIAPMKINLLKTLVLGSRARCGIALFVYLFSIWIALTPGAAQSKSTKRITSLHIGEASEGSRVTVVSDAALNDYEAFRRGDRFYVRIPLAYFGAGQPGFRGDGFEDVQVQKIGDSVVISFKLQPGATARVDQRSNRLDIIFSAPNKMARTNGANTYTNRSYVPTDGIVRAKNAQTLQRRDRDAAGPMPPGSPVWPQGTRERVVAERSRDSQTPRSQSVTTNPRDLSGRTKGRPADNKGSLRSEASTIPPKSQTLSNANRSETSQTPSNANRSETSSTEYKHEPTPIGTPSTSPSYSSAATNTPAAPVASEPVLKSPGVNSSQSGKSRRDIVLQWVKANRQLALLGGLILLGLLLFLAFLFRRRKKVDTAKGHPTTLTQPKSSTEVVSNTSAAYSPVNSSASNAAPAGVVSAARPTTSEPGPSALPVASTNAPRENVFWKTEESNKSVPEPAMTRSAAVATPTNQARVPASSTAGTSTDEDQEREVFEL